jgi:hypothetical protein
MPRKSKLIAHLVRMNAKRARVASGSARHEEFDATDSRISSGESDDSEFSDSELPYWPAEDDNEMIHSEVEEAERLILKWVSEAQSIIRKPHIGVTR